MATYATCGGTHAADTARVPKAEHVGKQCSLRRQRSVAGSTPAAAGRRFSPWARRVAAGAAAVSGCAPPRCGKTGCAGRPLSWPTGSWGCGRIAGSGRIAAAEGEGAGQRSGSMPCECCKPEQQQWSGIPAEGSTQHLPNQAQQPHIRVDAAPLPPCSLVHGHAGQQLQLVGGLHGGDSRGQTHGSKMPPAMCCTVNRALGPGPSPSAAAHYSTAPHRTATAPSQQQAGAAAAAGPCGHQEPSPPWWCSKPSDPS